MNRWTIGGLAAACAGVGLYLVAAKKEPPAPAKLPAAPAVAVVPPPAPPAILPEVIQTTDLDPLLDPPAKSDAGAPFDAAPPVTAPANAVVPAFIPPATDDPMGVAPMPRGVADPSRVVWYGEHRVPRQVGAGRTEAELWEDIIDSHRRTDPRGGIGIGFFF